MSEPERTVRVLVTDGDSRAALAITRSLGRRGHTVVVAGERSSVLARHSRYCSAYVEYPDPAEDEQGFLAAIRHAVHRHGIEVLVPVTDITTTALAEHRHEFEPRCRLPFGSAEAISRASDKAQMVCTAGRLGIAVPKTVLLARPQALSSLEGLSFPVVVKSHRSRLRSLHGWISSTPVRYFNTLSDLQRDVENRDPREFPLLLQEKVQGPGMGVFAYCEKGVPLALFGHRRIREKPPTGGVSVLAESIEPRPDARAFTERLLAELKWDGIVMVEFKLDERDDTPKLMEINARFWGSLQLAIDAGVDFPDVLIRHAVLHQVGAQPAYRSGVRTRWLLGDADSLFMRLRGQGPVVEPIGRRLRAIPSFCRFFGRRLYYDNPKWSDPWPWVFETGRWIRGRS